MLYERVIQSSRDISQLWYHVRTSHDHLLFFTRFPIFLLDVVLIYVRKNDQLSKEKNGYKKKKLSLASDKGRILVFADKVWIRSLS